MIPLRNPPPTKRDLDKASWVVHGNQQPFNINYSNGSSSPTFEKENQQLPHFETTISIKNSPQAPNPQAIFGTHKGPSPKTTNQKANPKWEIFEHRFWPKGIIFHQPRFPEIAGVPFPLQLTTFWGEGPV